MNNIKFRFTCGELNLHGNTVNCQNILSMILDQSTEQISAQETLNIRQKLFVLYSILIYTHEQYIISLTNFKFLGGHDFKILNQKHFLEE